MEMEASIAAFEPLVLKDGDVIRGEVVGLTLTATVPKKEFEELIANQKSWVVKLDIKTKKRK